jgi:hypothetical protein
LLTAALHRLIKNLDALNRNGVGLTDTLLLTHEIPGQEIKVSRVCERPASLHYILQNMAVAMYAKLDNRYPAVISRAKPLIS